MNMVERVARALLIERYRQFEAAIGGLEPVTWEGIAESHREAYRLEARVMIAAMREPTDAMINAVTKDSDALGGPAIVRHEVSVPWRTMADAALAKSGE